MTFFLLKNKSCPIFTSAAFANSATFVCKLNSMRTLLFCFIAFFPLGILAQDSFKAYLIDPNEAPREHPMDMLHMDLNLKFAPEQGRVDGIVKHEFKALLSVDTLFLDAPGILVRSVRMGEKELRFESNTEGLIIRFDEKTRPGERYLIEIEYKAFPKKGLYFIGWNDKTQRSRKQIWTQGQGTDNRHWIPHYDNQNDKITTNIQLEFPSEYQVLSNGVLKAKKQNKRGTTHWNYLMDQAHASYLIMLGIGEYKIKTIRSESGKKINLWYYPDHEDRVEATYRYSKEMFDFFEKEIGVPYAWPEYAQIPVQDFMYGAMENTSATLFGDFFMVDERAYLDRNYVGVNAHELAHQWFGDLVTARSAKHHWLQESFATYYNMLYEREAFGQEHYEWGLRNASKSAIAASKNDLKPIANSTAGSTRHYPKGAHVLHMLKYVLGREEYNRSVKRYLEENKFQNVDSEDLLVAIHDELGLSLDWFWDEWVYRGGEPKFEVRFKEFTQDNKHMVSFSVKQVHETSLVNGHFKMPVVFEVELDNSERISKTFWIDDVSHEVSFEIPSDRAVAYALFDKGSNIMKELDFPKDKQMLMEQAKRAEHMIDRYDAIEGLRAFPVDEKRDFLHSRFKAETFHGIKNEILEQLKDDNASIDLWKTALTDSDSKVRGAALAKKPEMDVALRIEAEKLLQDSSYKNIETALSVLCASFPEKCPEYLDRTKEEKGINALNVRIKWLELAYLQKPNDAFLDELLDYTSPSYEFLTRISAAQSLQKLDYFSETFFHHLADAAVSSNSRLSGPAIVILKAYYAKLKWQKDFALWHQKHDYLFDWQRQKLEKAIGL